MAPTVYFALAVFGWVHGATGAALLGTSTRLTTTADVIGSYVLDASFDGFLPQTSCAPSMSFKTFLFEDATAPSTFPAPRTFNMQIPHSATSVNGLDCGSSGALLGVQSSHPFAADVVNEVVNTWARGGLDGTAEMSKLAPTEVVQALSRSPWVFAYDWDMRVCQGAAVAPGSALMFFQPQWDVIVGETASARYVLNGRHKYLLVTSRGKTDGCVYKFNDKSVDAGKKPLANVSARVEPGRAQEPDPVELGRAPEPEAEIAAETTVDTEVTEEVNTEAVQAPGLDAEPTTVPVQPTTTELPEPVGPVPAPGSEEEKPVEAGTDSGNVPSAFAPVDEGGAAKFETEDRPACFPAHATLSLNDGRSVRMNDIRVGDVIRVGRETSSDVYVFSHRDVRSQEKFMRIATHDGVAVTLSPGHYIYVNEVLTAAKNVRIGDLLELADGARVPVAYVSTVRATGVFAPHSLHGDLLVDGVRVSSYTTALHPTVAHHALAPLRWAYRLGLPTSALALERLAPAIAMSLRSK